MKESKKSDLHKTIESDKSEKDKEKRILQIRKFVLDTLKNSSNLKEFIIKSKSKLKELEEIDKIQRHKLDCKIKRELYIDPDKSEWLKKYKNFPDPFPNIEKNIGEIIFYSEYKQPKLNHNISETVFYENFKTNLFKHLEYHIQDKVKLDNLKKFLKNNQKIYNLVNFVAFTYLRPKQLDIKFLLSEIDKLKDDRISLYVDLIESNNRIIELTSDENEKIKREDLKKNFTMNIINLIKENPKIWTSYIMIVEDYAKDEVKGSKEKPHDFISREILNNTVSPKSVNDMISRHYKTKKKRQLVAYQNIE